MNDNGKTITFHRSHNILLDCCCALMITYLKFRFIGSLTSLIGCDRNGESHPGGRLDPYFFVALMSRQVI